MQSSLFPLIVFQTNRNIHPRFPRTRRRRALRRMFTSTTVPDRSSLRPPPGGPCRIWAVPQRPSALSASTVQSKPVRLSRNDLAFYNAYLKWACKRAPLGTIQSFTLSLNSNSKGCSSHCKQCAAFIRWPRSNITVISNIRLIRLRLVLEYIHEPRGSIIRLLSLLWTSTQIPKPWIPSGTWIQQCPHFLLTDCVSRYVCSGGRTGPSPQASATACQLRPTASAGEPWICRSIARPPRSLLGLSLSCSWPRPRPRPQPRSRPRSWKPDPKRGDWMLDIPGLLHSGHPESPDDRPEQPGDGQEHPEGVCLHRHIVAAEAPPPPLPPLSVSLCAITMDRIYQALSCRAKRIVLWREQSGCVHVISEECRRLHPLALVFETPDQTGN